MEKVTLLRIRRRTVIQAAGLRLNHKQLRLIAFLFKALAPGAVAAIPVAGMLVEAIPPLQVVGMVEGTEGTGLGAATVGRRAMVEVEDMAGPPKVAAMAQRAEHTVVVMRGAMVDGRWVALVVLRANQVSRFLSPQEALVHFLSVGTEGCVSVFVNSLE